MRGMIDASVRDVPGCGMYINQPCKGVDKGVVGVDQDVDQIDHGVDQVEMDVTQTCGTDMNQSCKV